MSRRTTKEWRVDLIIDALVDIGARWVCECGKRSTAVRVVHEIQIGGMVGQRKSQSGAWYVALLLPRCPRVFFTTHSGDGAARAKGSKMGVEDDTDRLYRNKVILAPMVRSVS